jgi:predicted transcriptional regulator
MDEITTLRFIHLYPRYRVQSSAQRSITRLLRLQLIKRAEPGYMLRSGGVELVVRSEPTPQWVRDMIERARNADRQM